MKELIKEVSDIIIKYPIYSNISFGNGINGNVTGYNIQGNNIYVDVCWWHEGHINAASLSSCDIDD